MKKKLLALLLCAALLLPAACVPVAADDKPVFISINDTLPPELVGCVTVYGDLTYVPYYVFTSYGFGIYYDYSPETYTARLYSSDRQISFDLSGGKTYDGDNYKYSATAVMRSGVVYVPLSFVARFFGGINYSSITGSEYGSILRLTDGNAVLTDAEFLRAAKTVMRTYAASYQGHGSAPATPTEAPQDIHAGEQIDLGFVGLPADGILSRLAQSRSSACFFLTAEEVRSAPDLVRRIVCSGHSLGVYCTADLAAEYRETAELMFAAARVCPELVTAEDTYAEACREQADMAGLAYCGFELSAMDGGSIYLTTSSLETGSDGASILLGSGEKDVMPLTVLLTYLINGKFNVAAPREIGKQAA